jgi:hypothetical protein
MSAEREIARRLPEGMQADKVWIFGSRVRGTTGRGVRAFLFLGRQGGVPPDRS